MRINFEVRFWILEFKREGYLEGDVYMLGLFIGVMLYKFVIVQMVN